MPVEQMVLLSSFNISYYTSIEIGNKVFSHSLDVVLLVDAQKHMKILPATYKQNKLSDINRTLMYFLSFN